jgi:hypothetical protein
MRSAQGAASFGACRSPKLVIWRVAWSRETYNTVAFSRDFMRPKADKEAIRAPAVYLRV